MNTGHPSAAGGRAQAWLALGFAPVLVLFVPWLALALAKHHRFLKKLPAFRMPDWPLVRTLDDAAPLVALLWVIVCSLRINHWLALSNPDEGVRRPFVATVFTVMVLCVLNAGVGMVIFMMAIMSEFLF
ncbi:MAG TPA: hypothetical protein VG796_26975 [Verrucomicrobiales bacterium]|nr:hypothetical protein [Verrucomicrobiales bacterium]